MTQQTLSTVCSDVKQDFFRTIHEKNHKAKRVKIEIKTSYVLTCQAYSTTVSRYSTLILSLSRLFNPVNYTRLENPSSVRAEYVLIRFLPGELIRQSF